MHSSNPGALECGVRWGMVTQSKGSQKQNVQRAFLVIHLGYQMSGTVLHFQGALLLTTLGLRSGSNKIGQGRPSLGYDLYSSLFCEQELYSRPHKA